MKILMITHWFYPRSIPRAFRAEELYKELLAQGYEVDLIVGDSKKFIYSSENYKKKINIEQTKNNIEKNKAISSNGFFQVAKKIIEYFIGEYFLITSGKFVYKNIHLNNYDSIISIGIPFYVHLLVAIKLRKTKNKPKSISDWGDPFYGDKVRKLAFYFKWIQKYVCRSFDYIVVPTKNVINYFKEYVDSEEKIKVIPQGFNFDDVRKKLYTKGNVPCFAYAGIFYFDKRNPIIFLDYLCNLDIDFYFTIYTNKHGRMYDMILKEYEKKLGNKLIIKEMIPRLDCIEELSKYDFLINMNNSNVEQVPSKLIDYALTGRPIYSFSQNDFCIDVFNEFLKGNYSHRTLIELDDFRISNIAKKFIDIMEV